jgi:hypothetical protein
MRRTHAAPFALLALVGLLTAAVPGSVAAADTAAATKAEHARVIKYWTADRIAGAKPRDFVQTKSGRFEPRAKPGGGSGTGASWTAGGPVVQRTGKVLFTMDGSNWVCSASAVNDSRSGFSLVLTAAHCAYDEVNRRFATNWTYVPSFDSSPTFTCSQSTYGCWTTAGGGLVVHNGYASSGGFNTQATVHDFAIAIVGPGGKDGSTQLDSLGSYPIAYPAISTGGTVHAFGYPAAGRYHGNDLTYCTGATFNDPYNNNLTWGIRCNMTGGSSGGPWIASFTQGGGGTLTSLNSYGYSGLSNMYGPKFNANTQAVWTRANSSTGNQIVN